MISEARVPERGARTSRDRQQANVYRQVLGSAWDALPALLRATHAPGTVRGRLHVRWGEGRLARTVAKLARFPGPRAQLAVTLHITPAPGGLRWVRSMGTTALTSTHAACSGLLIESFGILVYAFRLLAEPAGLRYVQEYCAIRVGSTHVRLPRWACPRVAARVAQTPAGVRTEVEVAAPYVGRVLRYEGSIAPAETEGSA